MSAVNQVNGQTPFSLTSGQVPLDAEQLHDHTFADKATVTGKNGEIITGDLTYDGRVILYIIKGTEADQTSYINYIKQLILAEELDIPRVLSIIDTKTQWFYRVHPERMVPSLKDQDPETKEEILVFEGTACLQYLADRYDKDGYWAGRTAAEKAQVYTWVAYQTAGIGPTAKNWLYFMKGYPTRANPVQLPRTIKKFHENTVRQWQILEQRLSLPGQEYIALKDRPTLADLSYYPYLMPWMFKFLDVDQNDYPYIQRWAEKMSARSAIKKIMEVAPTYGH